MDPENCRPDRPLKIDKVSRDPGTREDVVVGLNDELALRKERDRVSDSIPGIRDRPDNVYREIRPDALARTIAKPNVPRLSEPSGKDPLDRDEPAISYDDRGKVH
jgi:hypothetical protein